MTLLWFLLLLAPLVFFHELGHFLVAKLFRIKVLVFSIGFGPKIVGRQWGETEYRISWIPLGGYVSMLGESPYDEIPEEERHRSFLHAPPWKRFLIAAAGPLANLLLPIPILFFSYLGVDKVLPPVMGTVLPGLAAAEAGLRPGDEVLEVEGHAIQSFDEFRSVVRSNPSRPIHLKVRGVDGSIREVVLVPRASVGRNSVGLRQRVGLAGVLLASTRAVVGIVDPNSPAARSGLRTGDRVVGIYDHGKPRPVRFWHQLEPYLGHRVRMVVLRPWRELEPSVGLADATLVTVDATLEGVEKGELVLSDVLEDSPAHRWGLRRGDLLYGVARVRTTADASACGPEMKGLTRLESYSSFEKFLSDVRDAPFCLVWRSPSAEGPCFRAAVVAQDRVERVDAIGNRHTEYSFGVATWASYQLPEEVPVRDVLAYAWSRTWDTYGTMTVDMFQGIWFLLTGKVSTENVGGPIAIAQMAKEAADRGVFVFLQMMIILSLNLGLLNLLPIPVLDGGHIVFASLEMILRRRLSWRVREIASYIGLAILALFMLLAFWNDIVRLFRSKDVVKIVNVHPKEGKGGAVPLSRPGVPPCLRGVNTRR